MKILDRFLIHYRDEPEIEKERVRFLTRISIIMFFLFPVIMFYSVVLLEERMTNVYTVVVIPQTICWIIATYGLRLLYKGKRVLSAHLLLISTMSTLWIIFSMDDVGMPYQIDTIVFILGLMTMVPFALKRYGWIVWLYTLGNIIVLILFIYTKRDDFAKVTYLFEGGAQKLGLLEYFLDIFIAMLFIGYTGYSLFAISDRALRRADENLNRTRAAEEEVTRFKELMKEVIDSMPSVIIGIDEHRMIFQWNRGATLQLGISEEEALGRPISLLEPLFGTRFSELLKLLELQEVRELRGNVRLSKEGERIIEDCVIYPLQNVYAGGAVIRLDNVTEKKNMEEVLVQSEKMVSLGSLAAGVAHEINNPLAGIIQNLQVIRNRLEMKSKKDLAAAEQAGLNTLFLKRYLEQREIPEMIRSVLDTGQRAAGIVNGMLDFSRTTSDQMSLCDPANLLDATVELCRNEYQLKQGLDFRRIRIERDYSPALPQLRCHKNKIQQVFFNILRNGAEAMHLGRSRNGIPEDPLFTLTIYPEDSFISFEICDNGPGIASEVIDRIFDPFFTTKKGNLGTGLGLYVSFLIITDEHRGRISAESTPGHHTRFKISLPLGTESSMIKKGVLNEG